MNFDFLYVDDMIFLPSASSGSLAERHTRAGQGMSKKIRIEMRETARPREAGTETGQLLGESW